MGFTPIGLSMDEETGFGFDWHQIKVLFDQYSPSRYGYGLEPHQRKIFSDMVSWSTSTFGGHYYSTDDYSGVWVLQDFESLKNFIFLRKADAIAFKLRFA